MRADYTPIPSILRDIYADLEGDLVSVHEEWIMYCQLFGTNQRRIDLMNDTVPTFMANLQALWLDWITLSICRLAGDKSRIAGHDLSVIAVLHEQLDRTTHPQLGSRLDMAFMEVQRTCSILQTHRHNRIAHRNRAIYVNATSHELPSRAQIENALAAVGYYLNTFREEFLGSPHYFKRLAMLDDADTLLHCLLRAHEYDKLERESPGVYHARLRANVYYDDVQCRL